MAEVNYANAYKEVLIVLNNLIEEDYNKIPKEYMEFFKNNCNDAHEFKYDDTKSFEEQKLLDDTKYILFGLFERFEATQRQKEKINAFKNNYYNKLEEEKGKIYNPDNVFKKELNNEQKISNNNKVEVIEYRKSIFRKIINILNKIFEKTYKKILYYVILKL